MDHVVVDVEIQKTIEETPGGWEATDKLGVAVACLWEYRTRRMRVYGPEDVEALQERLLRADRISGYNIFNFDFPVIWRLSKDQWKKLNIDETTEFRCPGSGVLTGVGLKTALGNKCNDILRRIWVALGFNPDVWQSGMGGAKLDDIAGATLGVHKISDGALAPREYQKGRVQWVANYCADDVAIERDLTDFVDRYHYVIHKGKQLYLPKK